MNNIKYAFISVSLLAISATLFGYGQDAEKGKTPLAPAAKISGENLEATLLKDCGIGIDAKSLLAYLARASANEADLPRLDELIRQLGSDSGRERDEARAKLIGLGAAALTAVRTGLTDKDLEIATRCGQCLRQIEDKYEWAQQRAAVRLLLWQADAETVQGLIRFLPYSADDKLIEEIWFGVYQLMHKNPELRALLDVHVKDRVPARRALSCCLLARLGSAEQRAAASVGLRDSHPAVRLRMAQGLLGVKDASAVPVLIELLHEREIEICWSAEELVIWLAGDEAPKDRLGAATTESRRRCRDAWAAWWTQKSKVNWAQIESDGRRPGLLLILDRGQASDPVNVCFDRLWLCGCDARPRWQVECKGMLDAHFLPGNRLVTTHCEVEKIEFKKEVRVKKGIVQRTLTGTASSTFLTETAFAERFLPLPNGRFCDRLGELWSPDGSKLGENERLHETKYIQAGALALPPAKPRKHHPHLVVTPSVLDLGETSVSLPNGNLVRSSFWVGDEIDANNRLRYWRDGEWAWQQLYDIGFGAKPVERAVFPSPYVAEIEPTGCAVWGALTEGLVSRPRPFLSLVRLGLDGWPDSKSPDARVFPVARALIKGLAATKIDPPEYALEPRRPDDPRPREKIELNAARRLEQLEVRSTWRTAIVTIGPNAIPVMLERAFDFSNEIMQDACGSTLLAAKKLGISQNQHRHLLGEYLKRVNDQDAMVRRMAVLGVRCLGPSSPEDSQRVARVLVDTLLHDKDELIRFFAIDGFFLDCAGLEPEIVVPALLAATNDKNASIRQRAARALGGYPPGPKQIDKLLEMLKKDQDYSVAQAFAMMGEPGKVAVPAILEAMKKTRDPSFANPLINLGVEAEQFVSLLHEILMDKHANLDQRGSAAAQLGRIGAKARSAIPALEQIIRDEQPGLEYSSLRFQAEKALKQIN